MSNENDEQMRDFDKRLKIRARQAALSFGSDRIQLFAYTRDRQHCAYAEPLIMNTVDEYTRLESFCEIENHEAQILMDDLWSAGIRPTEGSGSAGAIKAVQDHLADMKKILFHKLGIKE